MFELWKKYSIGRKLIIIFIISSILGYCNYYTITKINHDKEEKILNENLNNFKKLNTDIKGNFNVLIMKNEIEMLNQSNIYNNAITGEISINDTKKNIFTLINILENKDKSYIKGFNTSNDNYIKLNNKQINTLTYNYHKNLFKQVNKVLNKYTLPINKNNIYSLNIKNSILIKNLLKEFDINDSNSENMQYYVKYNNFNEIIEQSFKINYLSNNKENKIEYISTITKNNKNNNNIKIDFKEKNGDNKKLLSTYSRKLK